MELKGIELFRVGRWNDIKTFNHADLDQMVNSFRDLDLGGRVPFKFGHNDEQPLTDGQPALGWLRNVRREGDVLLGDFTDMPKAVYDAVKAGLYKFVSVELVRDVVAGGREYPWVLTAVALLGADIPAVSGLRDLQALTMARQAVFQGGTRMSFKIDKSGGQNTMDEVTKLKLALVDQAIDFAITSGRCTPAERERFTRRYGDKRTVADWNEWLKDAPRPPAHMSRQQQAGQGGDNRSRAEDGRPDSELVTLALAEVEKSNGQMTYFAAQRKVLRANPELADRYRYQPGTRE